MKKKLGKQTIYFENPPSIVAASTVVSKKESEGPLGSYFDIVIEDSFYGEDSWEKAESKFLKTAIANVMQKSGLKDDDIDYLFAGDLLNQCSGSHFAVRSFSIPFFGIYGACSTMAESLSLAAMSIDGGYANKVIAATSSHFCSAEKQFRFPLEYGGQRPPTAQWTATGSGAAVVSEHLMPPYITHVTTGKIIDMGVTDANNMGAAMAPAAADTIISHFDDTGFAPCDYDLIITGDLGLIGKDILKDLTQRANIDISIVQEDCGCILYDIEKQDVHSGGSGCGCSAVTFCGKLISDLRCGIYSNILFIATGALMNTLTCQQGESIPCIAHAVRISTKAGVSE